jgi:hypothetical protein
MLPSQHLVSRLHLVDSLSAAVISCMPGTLLVKCALIPTSELLKVGMAAVLARVDVERPHPAQCVPTAAASQHSRARIPTLLLYAPGHKRRVFGWRTGMPGMSDRSQRRSAACGQLLGQARAVPQACARPIWLSRRLLVRLCEQLVGAGVQRLACCGLCAGHSTCIRRACHGVNLPAPLCC